MKLMNWVAIFDSFLILLLPVRLVSYCAVAIPSHAQCCGTVEPRFNEPLFNKVLDITNDTLRPGQNYSKMYGIEPRYNEPPL